MDKFFEMMERGLTHDEFCIGKGLFSDMKKEGIPSSKAAALIYHAGRISAMLEQRNPTSPPEANAVPITDEEGSQTNE